MKFPALRKLLTNNGRFGPDDADYRRVYLMNIILILLLFFSAFACLFNFFGGSYGASLVDVLSILLGISTLIYFHKTDNLKISSLVVLGIVFCALVVSFVIAENHYILAWISVLPPLIFFLLGRRQALIVLSGMLGAVFVFLAVNLNAWRADGFVFSSFFNIVVSTVALCFLIWFFELSRREAVSDARQKNAELHKANAAIQESREYLNLILDSTAEAIFGIDLDHNFAFCNKRCMELLGYDDRDAIIGQNVHALIHSRGTDGALLPESACNIIKACDKQVATYADSEVFWHADGSCFYVEYYAHPQYKDGELIGAVVTFADNTEKKIHTRQIEYYGSHDSLTGLMNRRLFYLELRRANEDNDLPICIIMADLNGLKLSNDVFGHEAGDKLIIQAADALKKSCRDHEIIARLGGDEFAILLKKTSLENAQGITKRIKDALARGKNDIIPCCMSLGCAVKTTAEQDLEVTLRTAESEMYKEKALNRDKISKELLETITQSLYHKSPRERQHAQSVGRLCGELSRALGLPETETAYIERAGRLHDIGKISLPEELLGKQGTVTEADRLAFRQHPVTGYRLLNLFDNTLNLADAVYSHHERWDGTGYPRALKAGEIPLAARIVAIAGRFDRCTSGTYGKPVDAERALAFLEDQAGILFDPLLVRAFVGMIRSAPSPYHSVTAADETD